VEKKEMKRFRVNLDSLIKLAVNEDENYEEIQWNIDNTQTTYLDKSKETRIVKALVACFHLSTI
jgi:hypothetical protein